MAQGTFVKRDDIRYEPEGVMVLICSTLALYNSCELLGLIFATFKRRSGLYFWSILLATFGVIPYTFGWLVDYFDLINEYVARAFASLGWMLLITGQSVVLYSRLHLVLQNPNILCSVLWMIVFNGVVWHTSMTVLLFVTSSGRGEARSGYSPTFNAMEKTQMTCFCVQEFIISGLYIWKTVDILRTSFGSKRRYLWHLCGANVVIVIMDIALLVVEYQNHYLLQQGLKVVVYSIKLKMEFLVLDKLVEFVQHRGGSNQTPNSGLHHTGRFVELSDRPKTTDKRSTKLPEAIHLENLNAATVEARPCNSHDSDSRIKVTTRIDVDGYVVDDSNGSTDELYYKNLA